VEAFLTLFGYFCAAAFSFGTLMWIVQRLHDPSPWYHRYGIPRDRGLSSDG
jgi:hypothetical protein